MQPRLTDSGTFATPVDVTKPGLSQVISSFEVTGLGKKPYLSLVPVGSKYVLTVEEPPPVTPDRPSMIDPSVLRPTLLSPPPLPSESFDRRHKITFCLAVSGAVTVLLIIVVLVASI